MSIQLKKLTGPNEIRREDVNVADSETNTTIADSTYNESDPDVFTCYFSRDVVATDYVQPTEEGEVASITITISTYDENGALINDDMTVTATAANIKTNDADNDGTADHRVCFKLRLSDADYQRFGGGSIYIHANIADTGDNISFRATFTNNYHETIKHVHIYDEKRIDSICWSSQCDIPATGESTVRNTIALNDDAYVHIRTRGLWGKNVLIGFYEAGLGDDILLARINTPLYQNRKVITISMKYLYACYCREAGEEYNQDEEINLNFLVKAQHIPTETINNNNLAVSSPAITELNQQLGNQEEDNQPEEDPFNQESGQLNLTNEAAASTETVPENGTVFVQVNGGKVGIIGDDRYQDFLIGYMCHVEGVGKLANRHNNLLNADSRFTIYPFHAYKIMLSDLVACGLVTVLEAGYLTTVGHNMQQLETQTDLETNFNKTNAPLDSTSKQLIGLFQDNSYRSGINNQTVHTFTNRANIRKALVQVQASQTDELASDNSMRYVCRDAWQKRKGSNGRIFKRSDTDRYSYAKECPFGEYFINYRSSTTGFQVFVSRNPSGEDIDVYNQTNDHPLSPNQMKRDYIAFHRGGSGNSIGCITFNSTYARVYSDFEDILYPTSPVNRQTNNRMLNLVCIDERHAVGLNPDSQASSIQRIAILHDSTTETINQGTLVNFYRFYDLKEPIDTTETVMSI